MKQSNRGRCCFAAALVIIMLAICLGGCVQSSSPHDLAMAVSGGGTTDPVPGLYPYNSGTVVAISATPDFGYKFTGWSGDPLAIDNPGSPNTTITIDSDKYITANFVPIKHKTYFSLNQRWIEGFYAHENDVDLDKVETVFWHVFSQLPDEVTVYPSENYFYYILHVDGRLLWGNIRLAAGYRDKGELSFAYFEFNEFASPGQGTMFTRSKIFKPEDGLIIEKIDRFAYDVKYNGRTVRFNLNQIPQDPPKLFDLRENEVSVERTMDESGYQFFLLFNTEKNYFFWVLNEENGVPDVLDPVGDSSDIVVGRRSGFAFWIDGLGRKVLFSIRQHSVTRNDYYDGPFDQLADNYAEEVHIRDYMIKAMPSLDGRINEFGYYIKDQYGNKVTRPMRVALSMYQTYYTQTQFLDFIERAKASDDPYQYIATRGQPGSQ